MLHISSAANPRFKLARSLLQRKGREQNAQLLIEGVRLIGDSISAGFPPALLLFDSHAEPKLRALLKRALAARCELVSVEPEMLAELCDTETSQGVVAIAPIPQIQVRRGRLVMLVDAVRDPGNLGTLLRSAAAADVGQVILLKGVTDPWAPKVLRAAMGAHFRVAIRQASTLAEAESWLGPGPRYLAAAQSNQFYTQVDWRQSSVLIVGGEAAGPEQAHQLAGVQSIAIPMANGVESLNVAVAASIILFEAARQRHPGSVTGR